jgi:hypothetical protein
MNELQLGVLAMGVLAVVGVVAYNKWQEKQAERRFGRPPSPAPDVLMEQARALEAAEAAAAPERQEPQLFDDDDDEDLGQPAALAPAADKDPVAAPPDFISPLIDHVASFSLVEAVSAGQILAFVKENQSAFDSLPRPVRWAGFCEETGQWHPLIAEDAGIDGALYPRIEAAIQLADRQGALNEAGITVFDGLMNDLAEALMTVLRLPDPADEAARAQELDAFCQAMDVEIALTLVADEALFPGTKIRGLAESAGMTLGADGVYRKRNEDGRLLFCLANGQDFPFTAEGMRDLSTSAIVFRLDVPCVPRGALAFDRLCELISQFAKTLHGQLSDGNGNPVQLSQLPAVRETYVAKLQADMEAAGLIAGSDLALRLFSLPQTA